MLEIKSAQLQNDFQDVKIRRTLGNLGDVMYNAQQALQFINEIKDSGRLDISLKELCELKPELSYLLKNALGESYLQDNPLLSGSDNNQETSVGQQETLITPPQVPVATPSWLEDKLRGLDARRNWSRSHSPNSRR
jgi:hypothetical protein